MMYVSSSNRAAGAIKIPQSQRAFQKYFIFLERYLESLLVRPRNVFPPKLFTLHFVSFRLLYRRAYAVLSKASSTTRFAIAANTSKPEDN